MRRSHKQNRNNIFCDRIGAVPHTRTVEYVWHNIGLVRCPCITSATDDEDDIGSDGGVEQLNSSSSWSSLETTKNETEICPGRIDGWTGGWLVGVRVRG